MYHHEPISLPRENGTSLVGWIITEPALPQHEVRYGRVLLHDLPTDDEKATLLKMAEELEPVRSLKLEWLYHHEALGLPHPHADD